MLVQAGVELGIKLHRVVQRVGGDVLVVVRNLLEQLQLGDHLVRHIQAHHAQLPAGGEHQIGRMRVVPDIGFGHWRHIAGLQHRAAHDHHAAHQLGQRRLQLQRRGQVAQRADRHQRDLAGMRARNNSLNIDGVRAGCHGRTQRKRPTAALRVWQAVVAGYLGLFVIVIWPLGWMCDSSSGRIVPL